MLVSVLTALARLDQSVHPRQRAPSRNQAQDRPGHQEIDPNVGSLAPGNELQDGKDRPGSGRQQEHASASVPKTESQECQRQGYNQGTSWMPDKRLG